MTFFISKKVTSPHNPISTEGYKGAGTSRGALMAIFDRGTKSLFLTTLDIRYGYIYVEGYDRIFVATVAQADATLAEALEKNILAEYEARLIREAVQAAGILPTMDEVSARIMAYKIPKDFVPAHGFKLCTECPNPLPHGYIHREDNGQRFADFRFDHKNEGITMCVDLVRGDKLHVLDAIHICQQIAASPLPVDQKAYRLAVEHTGPETFLKIMEEISRDLLDFLKEERGE